MTGAKARRSPRSHDIIFPSSVAEGQEPRPVEVWPRTTKLERRRFELLKRAYLGARYSPNYSIEMTDPKALADPVWKLRAIVETVCF